MSIFKTGMEKTKKTLVKAAITKIISLRRVFI